MKQPRASALLSKGENMKNLILCALVLFLAACGGETKTVEKVVEVPVIIEVPVEPEKPTGGIVITIDDGAALSSILDNIALFESYGALATYYVSHHSNAMNEYLLTLQDVYGWEIGNHTQMHKNALTYSEQYSELTWLNDEVLGLQKKLTDAGLNVTSFSYPFGAYSVETNEVLKPHFKSVRGFGATKNNYNEGFYNDGFYYQGVSVDSDWIDREKLTKAMDKALDNGENLVLATHVLGEWSSPYHIKLDDLEFILDYAQTIGLEFKTMREL